MESVNEWFGRVRVDFPNRYVRVYKTGKDREDSTDRFTVWSIEEARAYLAYLEGAGG